MKLERRRDMELEAIEILEDIRSWLIIIACFTAFGVGILFAHNFRK